MKKAKILLLVSAILIELAAIIMIFKSYINQSSPATGLTFLGIGLVFLITGISKKENGRSATN